MKVCPQCQTRYGDDEFGTCPEDGAQLVPEGTGVNPRLPEVIPVDEAAETRMFAAADVQEELSRSRADTLDDASGSPQVAPTEHLSQEVLEEAMREAQARRAAQGGERAPEKTDIVPKQARAPGGETPSSGRAGLIAALTVAGVMLVALVIALAFVFWPKPTYLKITSTPSSAKVEIDGMLSGEAPINLEVKPGPHSVSLALDGYHPFAQVVEVPKEGRILAVALVENKPAPESQPMDEADVDSSLKARTEAIFQEVDALIDVGDLDTANDRLQVLSALMPGDERVAEALDRVKQTRAQPDKGGANADAASKTTRHKDPGAQAPTSRKDREREADKLHREGQQLYKQGDFARAKEVLLKAVRFDPRFYPPHRVLARIYNREKNISKAKYHLTRYIELGGSDADYKIRQWLATH